MYDVTREELVAAVEAEEREWLSTDDIHPYKSRVPQTKGNMVSFPKITKFNTYLLNHYGAEIVEEINGLLYDGELAAICGVDGFYSQQLTHDRCRIDPRMTFWRVNKYEFTADLVVYLKANAYNDDYSGLQSFTLYVSLDFCIDDRMTYEFGNVSLKQPERDRIKLDDYLIPIKGRVLSNCLLAQALTGHDHPVGEHIPVRHARSVVQGQQLRPGLTMIEEFRPKAVYGDVQRQLEEHLLTG